MILLEPAGQGRRAELAEHNHSTLEILYFVTEAEDGQVEFQLEKHRQRLSTGAEVLVPAGKTYALRNLSRTTNARLVAVVPQLVKS